MLDPDQSGDINFEEFLAFMKNEKTPFASPDCPTKDPSCLKEQFRRAGSDFFQSSTAGRELGKNGSHHFTPGASLL